MEQSKMNQQTPILFTDEQVQHYIADGYIIVDSNLSPAFHSGITERLDHTIANELPHPGDNIVPRIPALDELCESPVVRGALISLLGEKFAMLPHRFPHNSEPLGEDTKKVFDPFEQQPKMGKGSVSGSGWHQDGHSHSGRSRWHASRAVNVFYFPHDTPLNMGPTRFLAGTHLHATLRGMCAEQVVFQIIPAGSVVIAHFDIGHAGTPNNTNTARYMVKFVAVRTQNPTAASWDHQDSEWRTPDDLKTPHVVPVVWKSLWNWMRGVDRSEGLAPPSREDLTALIEGLGTEDQGQRLSNLYTLIAAGAPVVEGLVGTLLATSGLGRHESLDSADPGYFAMSKNVHERRFGERQFVPEDAAIALAAIGAAAVPTLKSLLVHDDPWIRINAAYALGDAGPQIAGSCADDIAKLLDDSERNVVRAALDALCVLGTFSDSTVKRLHHILAEDNKDWNVEADGEPRLGGHWTMQNQARYLSALALLAFVSNASTASAEVEAALITALDDDTGYTPAMACLALERLGTVSAMRSAIRYLRVRRLDASYNNSLSQSGGIAKAHRVVMLARLEKSK
jgi:hypothetical protein